MIFWKKHNCQGREQTCGCQGLGWADFRGAPGNFWFIILIVEVVARS